MAATGLKEVARAAGVSVTTVSRFINGSLDLPDRTREQVERAIRDLNYVPNPHARRLSLGRSDTIGLVVPDIATPFFATLVAAVEAEADRRGLALALHATLNRAGRETGYLAAIQRNHVDGIIFVTNHPDDGTLADAINRSGRVVVLDEDVPGTAVPKLFCDNDMGGYLAGLHLARAGHRRVLFVGEGDAMLSGARRHAGFVRAMSEVWGDGARIVRLSGEYSVAFGRAAGARYLEGARDCTAIFATSDELTIGILEVLQGSGLSVPRDVSLVGFDDVGPLHLFAPGITAIRQPVRNLGARALSLLLDAPPDAPGPPPEELLPVTLIARDSVAPPLGSPA
ncbi:MAG: LacI family transcriptional regulator [Rhodobacteraceae bacterium]|nr:LacI family transcriptional regulator [Paracoccaceae bacterium]